MNNTTIQSISLPFWTCFFLNSENGTYQTTSHELLLTCNPQGKFLFGNGPTSQSYGHAVCIILTVLIWLFGLMGMVLNTLCILFLPRSMKNLVGSLSFLVVALAVLELITSVFGVISVTTIILILENASRNQFIFYLFYITQPIYSFGRVGVIYTTLLISVERYLVVTYPTRSKSWLTSAKSKLCFLPVIFFALFINIRWLINLKVVGNEYRSISPDTNLTDFPYIFENTKFARNVWSKVWTVLIILKTVIPIPLLLYFNGMLYKSIRMWNKRKRALTNSQKREIDAATMLSAVVILIFLWNIPYFLTILIEHLSAEQDDFYRELLLFKTLCMIISTNVNFFMYFRFAKGFRKAVVKFTGLTWNEVEEKSQSRNVSRNHSPA